MACLRKFPLKIKFFMWLAVGVFMCTVILRWIYQRNPVTSDFTFVLENSHYPQAYEVVKPSTGVKMACGLPDFRRDDPIMMEFFTKMKPVDCHAHHEDPVYVDNGTIRFFKPLLPDTKCYMYPLIRGPGDYKFSFGTPVENVTDKTPLVSDFFKILCKQKSNTIYENIHSGVHLNATLKERTRMTKIPADGLQLSVAMLGFDSMSRMSWLRRMPKTREYLVKELGAIELNGYSIMGDGTPAALFPILTAKHEQELPEARRKIPGAKPVDNFPWIWKEFQKNGYITSFAESSPSIATFNYRLLGFEHSPTDFFMRPFYLAAEEIYSKYTSGCHGSWRHHQVWFNFIREIFKVYKDDPKFIFNFYDSLSHRDNNLMTMGDEDFYQLLHFLQSGGYFKDTLLIIFADHGARFSNVRASLTGKLEERTPYFSLLFPEWFKRKHPDILKNVETNSQRLTTPMDVHETLKDILHFTDTGPGSLEQRGISLFKEIPKERTCDHAGILPHWCYCMSWTKAATTDENVLQAAQGTVNYFNDLMKDYRDYCATLVIKNIISAFSSEVSDSVLRFKQSSDDRGLVPDMSQKMKQEKRLYQLIIVTAPSDGQFEVTIKHDLVKNIFELQKTSISRINRYGNASDCVSHKTRELRPFCYCQK